MFWRSYLLFTCSLPGDESHFPLVGRMNFIRPKFCRGLVETSTVFSRPLAGLTNRASVRLVTSLSLPMPWFCPLRKRFWMRFFCKACKQCYIWYVKWVRNAVSHGTYDTFLIIESSSVRVPLGQFVVMLLSVHSGSLGLALGVNSPFCYRHASKVYS